MSFLIACVAGCMDYAAGLSAQDPKLRASILAAGRGDRPENAIRAQAGEEQEMPPIVTPLDRPTDGSSATSRVAVLINGEAILEEEVRAASIQQIAALAGLPDEERLAKAREVYKTSTTSLIEREVVIQDIMAKLGPERGPKVMSKLLEFAEKEFRKTWMRPIMEANNFKTEEELRETLEKSGTSLKSVRYGWERNFMAGEYLRNKVYGILDRIGHPQIEEYYQKHPDEFVIGDGLVWQDLFIDASRHPTREEAKKFAESLADRIRRGEDFAKLSDTFDNGDAKLRANSEGEGRKKGEIRPSEVEDALFRLREKDVGPVIETATGYHIIRVMERSYAGKKLFDEKVQKQIRDKLRNDLANKEIKRIVADLKARAIIEYPK